MIPALQLDYLFVGRAIRARLIDQVADLAVDGAVFDIEGLEQAVQRTISAPTAFVGWDGDYFDDTEASRAGGGRSTQMLQGWSVVIAARNATQQAGAFRDDTVGPLLANVHTALAGWTPTGALRPLVRTQGRRPEYRIQNTGLYALTFHVSLAL